MGIFYFMAKRKTKKRKSVVVSLVTTIWDCDDEDKAIELFNKQLKDAKGKYDPNYFSVNAEIVDPDEV